VPENGTISSHVAEGHRDRVLDAPDPYVKEWEWNGHTWTVEIPAGFKYRPTTTPLPRTLISLVWGRYALEDESLAHDYTWKEGRPYYRDGELVEEGRMPKGASDALLLDGSDMRILRWGAWVLSMTVGWAVWWDWHEEVMSLFGGPRT
jgi:hypothetical protein